MPSSLLRVSLLAALAAGCNGDPERQAGKDPQRCERLLAHVAEVRGTPTGALASSPEAVVRRTEGIARALGRDHLAACERAREETVSCLLAATTPSELEACPQLPFRVRRPDARQRSAAFDPTAHAGASVPPLPSDGADMPALEVTP
jgi:hypothetical protein